MRVHHADPLGRQAGLGERAPYRAALPVGVAGRDVVGVRGDRRPGERRVGVPAGPQRGALQHQDGRALADHEAVPVQVERAGGVLRVVVAQRVRAGLREPGQRERVQAGLGAARDHHVGAAEPDQVQAERDRLRAGRARADRGVRPGLGPEVDRHPGGRPVRHQHRHGVRRDLADTGALQHVVLLQHRHRPAGAGADHHRDPLPVHLRTPRVGPRLAGRDERQLLAAVQSSGLDPVHHLGRFDGELAGDPDRQFGRPLPVDRPDAAPALQHGLPGGRGGAAERGGGPQAGDQNAVGVHVGFRAHSSAPFVAMAQRSPPRRSAGAVGDSHSAKVDGRFRVADGTESGPKILEESDRLS